MGLFPCRRKQYIWEAEQNQEIVERLSDQPVIGSQAQYSLDRHFNRHIYYVALKILF